MRLLDLFCGRWGWSRVFAERGWDCVGIDLIESDPPKNCRFIQRDILKMTADDVIELAPDFIVASSPCEEFSVHGMAHFHPNPKYPELGIRLFNHTRSLCETSGLPYVMENVRSAQKFVGLAMHRCGPFYLWGNAVPLLLPQGVTKGVNIGSSKAIQGMTKEEKRIYRLKFAVLQTGSASKRRETFTAGFATIPDILAAVVAKNAENICAAEVA